MDLITRLASWSLFAFGAILFLAQIGLRELGFWAGRRRAATRQGDGEGVGLLINPMLGLLSFVLALTLAFANARFDERRSGALTEANAIGTAWLRATAIGGEQGQAIAGRLEEYAQARADFVRATGHEAATESINQRTAELQSDIWRHLAIMLRETPGPVAATMMTALNETFDASNAQRFAYEYRHPQQLSWLLLGMILLSMAALGFQLGLGKKQYRSLSILLAALWTIVTIDIIDLGTARIGAIRTDALVYDWTIASFRADVSATPSPGK
jgi:hypothetical protein